MSCGRAFAGLSVLALLFAFGCSKRTLSPEGTGTGTLPVDGGGAGMGGRGAGGAGGTPRSLALGERCTTAGDCASGFCVEGVCCDAVCAGGCSTCVSPDAFGICVNRKAGEFPRTSTVCPVEIVESCGRDGTCDGMGACRLRPVNTQCRPGTCDGDAVVGGYVCDGMGNCKAGATRICVPFRCDPATASCRTGCTTDADCAGGFPCMNGSCRRPLEQVCISDTECFTGHCAQGVCCNVACDGPCLACNLTGRIGTCWPRPSGTDCGQPTCADGKVTNLKRCDSAGTCVDSGTVKCDPFTCDPATQLCRNSCTSDPECAPSYLCSGGSCGRREGQICDSGSECATGFCSRGICCDRACADVCHSCSVPGLIGICTETGFGEDCF